MIPAILSCIFVLYLYRTLDAANSESDPASKVDPQSNVNLATLSKELASLQSRLQSLASESKGDKP
jgi:hypothetical protein